MQLAERAGTEREAEGAWYALYTRHQHEKVVARLLAGKGFEVFLPLYTTAHRWRDRTRQLALPLFPGYVFLRTQLERRAHVVTTPGVHHFVPSAERPIAISQPEIEAVRQLTAKSPRVEPHPFLKRGDWVRIKRGPLAGLEGNLTRWKGAFKLVLGVELLQQSVAVEVEVADVEGARSPLSSRTARNLC
ncbi:MAG TPA: UpxY family transcription antiterminator [Terriglobia bacterium]|nr:UpxY family transcription antiterminator [Terriglobia bacterium]